MPARKKKKNLATNMEKKTVAILGAGSWGTAMAIHLSRIGHQVLLWGHNPKHIDLMAQRRINTVYLPAAPFPEQLTPCADLNYCLAQAEYVIVAVPSHAFAHLIQQIKKPVQGLAWLTKGIDPNSHQLLSSVVAQYFGASYPVAVLSGPSFAKEVAQSLPTALTLASNDNNFQQQIHQLVHQANLRVYFSSDLIGVQLCGAVKNVLAIACGISDGLGYGANAKAALITRGLKEMSRLGLSMGAQQETFVGLAGMGDLVLTCTDNQSRNRRFGLLLGQKTPLKQAEEEIAQVIEGKDNAEHVCFLAAQRQVDMPICQQINGIVHQKITIEQAVINLMTRPPKKESY